MPYVHLNGRLLPEADAAVPALDRGLLHGFGLFETMRSYNGRVFRLEAHYQRLADGSAALNLPLPLTLDATRDAIAALLERNALPDARVRLTLTAGPLSGAPSIIITAVPPTDYPPVLYQRGMSAITSAIRRNETSPLCHIKSLNYLDNLLAREEARRKGADVAILLNTRGFLAEGSHANIFIIQGDRLLTPSLDSGILPGVTRAVVLELAPSADLTPVEGDVEPQTLLDADEAFLTGSIMEIMPLVRVDEHPIGDGQPGPVTSRLMRLFREAVERETESS